jgi:hypothetical protein
MELSSEDKDNLLRALEHILNILHRTVNDDLEEIMDEKYKEMELVPIFRDSFLNSRDELVSARRAILNATEELVKKLKEHDLIGKSSVWKTKVIEKDYNEYTSARKKKTTIWRPLLLKFLGGSEVLLESLADCIPGVGVGFELVKGLRHVIQ